MKYLVILLMLVSCGKPHYQKYTTNDTTALSQKYNLYLQDTPSTADNYGFVGDKCDSLLWTALYDSAGGETDLLQAEHGNGSWVRNPDGTCFGISRDMIIGLLTYIWNKRDLPTIERLINYGEAHSFKMSVQDNAGESIMTPDMIATAYEIRYKLGGGDSVARLFNQSWWFSGQKGFEAHLQALHILLRGNILGTLTTTELNLIKTMMNNNPQNALFAAVYHRFTDGDQSSAIESLMNTQFFPSDGLPTNAQRCEAYIFQRDEFENGKLSDNWSPCQGNETHPGVDLEFAAAVVLGKIK